MNAIGILEQQQANEVLRLESVLTLYFHGETIGMI